MQEVFEKIIEKMECEYENLKEMYKRTKDMSFYFTFQGVNKAIEIVKKESEKRYHGHFGCNTNGDHERCDGCGLTNCNRRNKIWFGVSDDNNGWILCNERLPEEHDSMFARFKGTDKWRDSMFEKTSNEVTVTIADEKGDKVTTHAHTIDGTWKADILRACPTYRVIAWQSLPAPYQPNA